MDEINFYNRYTQSIETEKVYGDSALRWTYGTSVGRLSLNLIVKRAMFSRWYGWQMGRKKSQGKIAPFIQQYGLDATEFLCLPNEFANFNEFFFRKLKKSARPISSDPDVAVFPADGRHLCIPDLSKCSGLFVKGAMFSIEELLVDQKLAKQYSNGSLLLSRLCPVDYHRFHFPISGTPGVAKILNGPLYSVNPIALRQNIRILSTNKRFVTELRTEKFGTVLLLEIGATCVGSICQTYSAGKLVEKGDEKGYFKFGGSSTITIFEPGRVQFDDDLIKNSQAQREVYAHMGDHMSRLIV